MINTRIAVLGTGGTIASTDLDEGAIPTRSVDEILKLSMVGLNGIEVVVQEDIVSVLSPAMTPLDMWAVIARARELVRSAIVSGVVVTHGTATMQETAYLADLTWSYAEPIVFTGSMRTIEETGSDACRNLRQALLVASSDAARGFGSLVVMNGEIHSARSVRKIHKSAVNAFSSGIHGALGCIDGDEVLIYQGRHDRRVFRIDTLVTNVSLIKAYTGMDDSYLRLVHERGDVGVVIECFPGRGSLPPCLLPAVRDLVDNEVPVLLAGDAEGRISPVYGGPCGTQSFMEAGALTAGDLSSGKARMLLMVLLSRKKYDRSDMLATIREVEP